MMNMRAGIAGEDSMLKTKEGAGFKIFRRLVKNVLVEVRLLPRLPSMALNFAACTVCNTFPSGLILLFLVALVSSTSAKSAPLHARSGGVLQVLVPAKSHFKEFAECSDDASPAKGFCIDVFKSALDILIPTPTWTHVTYNCFNFGRTYDNMGRSYDTMLDALSDPGYRPYDAVVADTTILASRLEMASFTQPYLDSGVVVVTPVKDTSQSFAGVFFVPFTIHTWGVLMVSIALTGLALWLIECNQNSYLQRIGSRFVTSILIFFRRESITNPLSKFVMIAWVLFILLLGSSYTASLSSILTVNELSSESLTIKDLSNSSLPVGYRPSSIAYWYLTEKHNITNLVPLSSTYEFAEALHNKTVVAVVDEIPYVSLFLAAQSALNCRFAVSPKLTIEGFGFAFYDKALSDAFSVAILNLSESGQMQNLKDGWKLSNFQCPSRVQSTRLDVKSVEGLFMLLGSAMLICLVFFLLKHVVVPYWAQTYTRIQANPRQDAIDAFWEPNFHGSTRRWFSARHLISHEEFA